MTLLQRVFAGFLALSCLAAVPASAAERTLIILDGSGSMWGQIGGKPKLEIAREALRTVLADLPADREVGFMAYGHREKGKCDDIELIVPPAAGTAEAIGKAADAMKFVGKTPLTAAVRQAADDMKYTEDKATVVLITDGLETCEADPCALAGELEQKGVDFTAHVVGFGLTAEEGKQVACLADKTGGRYIQADDAAQLKEALAETVVAAPAPPPAPEPDPAPQPAEEFNLQPTVKLSADGPLLDDGAGNVWVVYRPGQDGERGEYVMTDYNRWKGKLEPGDYVLVAEYGQAKAEQPITIRAGEVARPEFVLDAGTIMVRPLAVAGQEPDASAAVRFEYPGGDTTEYGEAKVVVPAGDQTVKVTIGAGMATESFALAAGATVRKDIVVGVGHVVVNAFYVEGMKVEDGALFFRIVKAKKAIDGSQEQVSYEYGPDKDHDLPPGDYVALAEMDQAHGEAQFKVASGDNLNVSVVLQAGVLSIAAPGATRIAVLGAAKDIQGNRKEFGVAYSDKHQTTLPAGDYVVQAEYGEAAAPKEATAKVTAGERTEISIP
ncbi:MAG: VWA domain-containing protein [Rhizobiaceae bacterium]|nr:VWA domain-containing protein [Rhizobiaceae bacterium]